MVMASSESVQNVDAHVLALSSSNSAKRHVLCNLRLPFIRKKLYVLIFVHTDVFLLLREKVHRRAVKCDDDHQVIRLTAMIYGPSHNINLNVSFFVSDPYTKKVHL